MININKIQNPLHMPHIQAIKQLIKHGYSGDIEDILELLEEESNTDPERIKKMNDEWNAQLYSSKSIDHLMMSTFDYFPQVHKASPEAQAVLSLMVRTQEQATGLVEVQRGTYAKVLGWGSKRAGRIKDCLQELKDINAISAIYEPKGGSTKPGIYQINAKFSKIGKGFKVSPVNPKTSGEYSQYSHTVSLLINGQKKDFKCGSIQKIVNTADDKKKRASAGLANSQSEPHTGSEPQDDSNPNNGKNQDSVINMQKNESVLTPEEEELFSGQMSFSDYPGVVPEGAKL